MAIEKIKVAVFISGRGSNMEALVRACEASDFPATISLVLSNDPSAAGLSFAQEAGLETLALNHKDYRSREEFERAIMAALDSYQVDLICLAGFMRILTPYFIDQWPDKIINIHPSLLPKYKGLNTHQRAIETGDKETGCSVHYVVPDVDSGETIVQRAVKIEESDTVESLSARVLEQEHVAYPQGLKMVADKMIKEMQ